MTLNGTSLFHYETYRTVVPELFGALETTPNGFTVSHSVSICLGDMPVAVPPSYFQGHTEGALRLDTQMREAQREVGASSLGGEVSNIYKVAGAGGIIHGDWEGHFVKLSCSSSNHKYV